MSTIEEVPPLGAAPSDTAAGTPAAADAEDHASGSVEPAPSAIDTLSPAVRRLVRQFDLDITGIHGTGPDGRIRVGDVMGLLGGRTDSGNRDAPTRPVTPEDGIEGADETVPPAKPAKPSPAVTKAPAHDAIPASTVFDCDLSRVLSHRRTLRLDNTELLTTSYFLTALTAALDATPEITAGEPPRFGVWLTTVDGERRASFLDSASVIPEASLDERVRAVDAALRSNLDADVAPANLLVHHYGESGSLLATPTPIGAGHAASVGIGRVRREIVVRSVDGVETPRVAACCYLTLSFLADRVTLHHANRYLALVVRLLEQWPE